MNELLSLDTSIRNEADELIHEKGLHNILSEFGTPQYTGSYALRLMTWRDLDIYLASEDLTEEKFFELGKKIVSAFHPVKMSFRNERIAKTPGLPAGLYWGVYLGNERAGAWKIDIWAMNGAECMERLIHCDELNARLTEQDRLKILEIKSKCWQDPLYRKSYSSSEIYAAVLDNGVEDFLQFQKWLQKFF